MTEALIRLRLSEIEYDVKFDTWGRANTQETPNEKLVYKGGDMRDWLLRQIENSVGDILAALRWCAVDHAHITDNEIMDAPDCWEIRLRWKGKWQGSESGLKSFAHQYIVQSALASWYAMVGQNNRFFLQNNQIYTLNAERAMEHLKASARKTSISTPIFRL